MTMPLPSQVNHNYHPDCEAAINNLIKLEFHASYSYLSMAFYFDRDYVALKHFSQYFLRQSREERERAERLMWLQKQRGARLRLYHIRKPERDEWENGLRAMKCALDLEKQVNQSVLHLHQLATNKEDAHLCDFLKCHYLHEKAKAISELGDHLTNLRKMGAPESGLAEVVFDKLTLGDSDRKN